MNYRAQSEGKATKVEGLSSSTARPEPAAAAVLFLLHHERRAQAALRRAGAAEKAARISLHALKIKEAQHEATANAAHTESDLLDRLRSGSF